MNNKQNSTTELKRLKVLKKEKDRRTKMAAGPETSTSPAVLTLTDMTGPLWWSIFITTSPVNSDVIMIRESSPPLTMTELFSAGVRLRTGAMCSLKHIRGSINIHVIWYSYMNVEYVSGILHEHEVPISQSRGRYKNTFCTVDRNFYILLQMQCFTNSLMSHTCHSKITILLLLYAEL